MNINNTNTNTNTNTNMDFIEINSLIQQLTDANTEIESLRQQLAQAKQKDINTWYLE